jgi:hypothetical protein
MNGTEMSDKGTHCRTPGTLQWHNNNNNKHAYAGMQTAKDHPPGEPPTTTLLAQSPTGRLIETCLSRLQPLLETLDLVVIMTDEDKTEIKTSRPSPLDPATEQAQPRQLTRDDQEWFSSFQQPAERLPYDCLETISVHSRSPRRCPQLLLRCRKAAQQRCTAKPHSVAVQPHSEAAQRSCTTAQGRRGAAQRRHAATQ